MTRQCAVSNILCASDLCFHGCIRMIPEADRPKTKTWCDYYADAIAAGMDDASACHAADTAVP